MVIVLAISRVGIDVRSGIFDALPASAINNCLFDTEQERLDTLDRVFPPDGDESRCG